MCNSRSIISFYWTLLPTYMHVLQAPPILKRLFKTMIGKIFFNQLFILSWRFSYQRNRPKRERWFMHDIILSLSLISILQSPYKTYLRNKSGTSSSSPVPVCASAACYISPRTLLHSFPSISSCFQSHLFKWNSLQCF